MVGLLADRVTLLVLPALWLLRCGFLSVDLLAAGCYESCFLNCNGLFPPPFLPPPQHPPRAPPLPPGRPPSRPPSRPSAPPMPLIPPSYPPSNPPPPPLLPVEPADRACDGLLASTAALNMFSVLAFVVIVSVRWIVPDRSYTEACLVTYILVALDVVLKLCDASLPIVLTVQCFPTSVVPPFNGTLFAPNCDVPCVLGDLYAMYGFYGISKCFVGVVDLVLATPFLVSKPRDWYRWGSTRLK